MTATRWVRGVTAAAAVAAPTMYLASLFPAESMFAATTATGGDLASHNYAARFSTELLWEEHRLTGWVPGNYCGFPLFQMYFPVPFVLVAMAAALLEPNVAYKLVTVTGVLALPGAAWFAVRRLGAPFPGPEIAAILTLTFLFQGGNAMWGGNLGSTLAGEFVYSISIPLALIYLALQRPAIATARRAAAAACLVAVLAMTHAYTILWVALAVTCTLLMQPPAPRKVFVSTAVFVWGGALCAFWLLPLLWYSKWTTAYKHVWVINSITEILPPLLWPALAMALVLPIVVRLRGADEWRRCRHSLTVLVAGALAAALAYVAAPNFGIVDVRFLPFLQLALCLIAGAAAGHALQRVPGAALSVPIAIVAVLLLIQPQVSPISEWIRWNYDGFERKALWPAYAGLADFLRGDMTAPRVAYEHAMENDALGTVRAFENLPLFSGRSTLEGVNLQASVTSPFIFFVQSELSQVMSCPFPEWGCSRPNMRAAVEHLRMLNVSDVILRSDASKTAAAETAELIHRRAFGPYDVYAIAPSTPGYATVVGQPYAVITTDWKTTAYRWFKYARADDPVPVFLPDPAEASGVAFAGVFTELPARRAAPDPPAAGRPLQTVIDRERIRIMGVRPGDAVLIRVSYHPRWRTDRGEKVWLAGPGFMLVFASSDHIDLIYSESAITRVALVVSVLAAVAALLVFTGVLQTSGSAALGAVRGRSRQRSLRQVSPVPIAQMEKTLSFGLLLCVASAVFIVAGVRARELDADRVYQAGQRDMDQGRTARARARFAQARDLAPLSNTAIHSLYFEAIILYREERWREASEAFQQLLARFPEAHAAAESSYHVGLCAERLEELREAVRLFAETRDRYPGTRWADLSAQRLRNLTVNP